MIEESKNRDLPLKYRKICPSFAGKNGSCGFMTKSGWPGQNHSPEFVFISANRHTHDHAFSAHSLSPFANRRNRPLNSGRPRSSTRHGLFLFSFPGRACTARCMPSFLLFLNREQQPAPSKTTGRVFIHCSFVVRGSGGFGTGVCLVVPISHSLT